MRQHESGFLKGMSKGMQELANAIAEILELRFGAVPQSLAASIHAVDSFDELTALRRKLRDAASVEECQRIVASVTPH